MITLDEIRSLSSRKAALSFIESCYNNDITAFVEDLNQSFNKLLHGNLKEAGEYVTAVSDCFSYIPKSYRTSLLSFQARYAHWTGDHKKAITKYNQAIEANRKKRDFKAIAQNRQGLMDTHMYLGAYDEALKAGKAALRSFQNRKNPAGAARVMTNIGNVYHRMDKNKMALRFYDRAREFFAAKGGVPLAIVDYNRANVLSNLGELERAEKLYTSATDIYRKNGLELIACKSEYSLAYLHFLAGRFSESLAIFEKVYDAFEALGDKEAAAVTNLDLAEINIELNQFGTSMMQGEQASDVFQSLGRSYEEAKAAYFTAGASRRLGDFSESEKYLNRAEKLFGKEKNTFWLGMVGLEKTHLYAETGKLRQARAEGAAAARLFMSGSNARRVIDAEIAMIRVLIRSGKSAQAIRRGEKLQDKQLIKNQEHELNHLLGECYYKQNEYKTALTYYKRAIKAAERMLSRLVNDEIRFFFALDKYPTYVNSIECLLAMNKTSEAFIQHSHALAVLNQKIVTDSDLKHEVPAHLLTKRDELRASLRKLQKMPDSAGSRHLSVENELRKTEYTLWSNELKIRSAYGRSTAQAVPGFKTETLQASLKPGEQLVNFIQFENRIGAFVATNDSMEFTSSDFSVNEFRQTIHKLHYLFERDVFAGGRGQDSSRIIDYYLRQLYDALIAPLLLKTTSDRLIFLIDGSFAQIPFHALKDKNGTFLKDKYLIQAIVNPEDLRSRAGHKKISSRKNAIFAVTNIGLPMIEQEQKQIAKLFPKAQVYTGKRATSTALKESFITADGYIHIASHASRASENPLFSRILMEDGPFYPFDLFENGINAELVSLSGCQTAAPGIYYGNAFSLAKAFYQAGAKYVLASLWSVSDKISMAFMAEFYKGLKSENDVSLVFNNALTKAEKISGNPALWSPFILIGI